MPKLASLLRAVGQEQRWWEALELLKHLWHRKDREEGLLTVASLCQRASAWQKSLNLLHGSCRLSSKHSAVVAASWSSGSWWERALRVLTDREAAAAALLATNRAAYTEVAVRLLCTLPHAEPKTSTTLVAACGKILAWRTALEAFGHLLLHGTVDTVAYNATMVICSKASAWTHVLCLFKELQAHDRSDRSERSDRRKSLATVLDACGQASEWERGMRFLCKSPGLTTLTAAIHSCKYNKKWILALQLFEALPSADLPAFGAVIAACASAGRWRQVLCLLEDMRRSDIESDLACKTALIDAVAKKSEWLQAMALLNTLAQSPPLATIPQHFGYVSDLVGPAVASCQEATQWEVALHLWHMAPSNAASHSLLLALSQAGKWFQSHFALKKMQQDSDAIHLMTTMSCAEQQMQPKVSLWVEAEALDRIRGRFTAVDEVEAVLYGAILKFSGRCLERSMERRVSSPLVDSLRSPKRTLKILQAAAGLGPLRTRNISEYLKL